MLGKKDGQVCVVIGRSHQRHVEESVVVSKSFFDPVMGLYNFLEDPQIPVCVLGDIGGDMFPGTGHVALFPAIQFAS